MIITDGKHLSSTTSEKELHSFAISIGLKKKWYQNIFRHPHYDLTTNRAYLRAIKNGAIIVSSKELIRVSWWNKRSK